MNRAVLQQEQPEPQRLWWSLDDVPDGWGRCVVTVGMFDGVHRGHRALLHTAIERGTELGLPVVLVTFDPHPARVTGRTRDAATLTSPERRAQLAVDEGIDRVLVLTFDEWLAAESAESFAQRVLADRLHAAAVVVGADFRFGAHAAGDLSTLTRHGETADYSVTGVDLVQSGGARCSSTRVRAAVAVGDISAAARLLGRPHRLEGWLLPHPTGFGSLLKLHDPNTALPAPGTYPARLAGLTPGPGPLTQVCITDEGLVQIGATSQSVRGRGVVHVDLVGSVMSQSTNPRMHPSPPTMGMIHLGKT
jgi:riboflavin kinase/FMN adenylyltransferase